MDAVAVSARECWAPGPVLARYVDGPGLPAGGKSIARMLIERGYQDKEIRKIAGNALGLFRGVSG